MIKISAENAFGGGVRNLAAAKQSYESAVTVETPGDNPECATNEALNYATAVKKRKFSVKSIKLK